MIGSKPIMLLLRYSICPLACLEICTLSPSTHLLSTYPSCFHNLLPNHLVKKVLLKDTSFFYIVVLFKNEQLAQRSFNTSDFEDRLGLEPIFQVYNTCVFVHLLLLLLYAQLVVQYQRTKLLLRDIYKTGTSFYLSIKLPNLP